MEQQNSKELRHKLHTAVSHLNTTTDEIVRLATEIKDTLQEAHTL